jgi:predicted SAM-dependent methyltransferase
LEHFPKQFAPEFLAECHRVLKPGGIIRVVQPDLEQIARLYLEALEKAVLGDPEAQNRYEWLMLELIDQMVRNRSGGEMLEYWKQNPMPAEEFVIERCGSQALAALQRIRKFPQNNRPSEDPYLKAIREKDQAQIQKMAQFRMSGETHQWLYDRYSLKKLLCEAGFVDPILCRADESAIPDFNSYHLDTEKDGRIRKPDSFYMEARKIFLGSP